MKLDYIISIANKTLTRAHGLNSKYPITITRTTREGSHGDSLILFIRNDVNKFNSQDKWQVMWIPKENRLYLGYNINGISRAYARRGNKDGGVVQIVDHDLAPLFAPGEKRGFYWEYDKECNLYYIEITKGEKA